MRYVLILFMLSFYSLVYAGRVCIEKGTGKLIEYQSGDAALGALTNNAINTGYKQEDIEEKYVTKEEWEEIKKEQIEKPAQEKEKQKKEIEKQAKDKLKSLGLTNDEANAIFNR